MELGKEKNPEEIPSFRLDGKVALVTGGSRRLGLGMARALATYGAKIVLMARNQEELEVARMNMEQEGHRVNCFSGCN